MIEKTLSITIGQQVEEMAREVSMTKSFYARMVREGKMRPEDALKHLARKMACLETLKMIAANRLVPECNRLRTITAQLDL